MIIMPITRPAASADSEATSRPSASPEPRISGATVSAAKKPSTTVGMPARISSSGFGEAAQARRGVFRHVDRREQAERPGHQHGDRG